MGERLRRRELLMAAGTGAAALALPEWARAQLELPLPGLPVAPPGMTPQGGLRPELVTVTERGFAAWWPTDAPADTTVRFGRIGHRMREVTIERGHRVHAASVGGLRPGTAYRYELVSNGKAIPASSDNPGRFRTLHSPGGRTLARIAVLNDLHVGESCSGTATNLGGQSVPPCFSAPDYAARMVSAAVRAIRRLKPDLLIVNGDLTDRGQPENVRRCLEILRHAHVPLLITRGNHDRVLHGAEGCGEDGDCLRTYAFPKRAPGDHALTSVRNVGRRLTVVGLDSCDPETGEGRLDLGNQIEFLDRQLTLARRRKRRAIVAFHHPVTLAANTTTLPPVTFGVAMDKGGRDCLDVLARHPHVALVLHGHTHRNYVSYDEQNPHHLPFLENGAVKEYPGGFAMLRVREGGVTRTFHRMTGPFCRDWDRTSAQQYFGHHPDYTLGPLSSRAFALRRDGRGRPPQTVLGPYELPAAAS
jgi:3',5'-cyclic-AMP phosphodiesterase